MAVLLNATFDTTDEGFTGATWNSGENWDFSGGYVSIANDAGAARTISKTFTSATSGVVRVDVWLRPSSQTAVTAGTTKDFFVYILPNGSAVSSANSATTFAIIRNTSFGASGTQFVLQYRNSSGFQNYSVAGRPGSWMKLSAVITMSTRKFDLYIDDVLWVRDQTCANGSFTDIGQISIIANGSNTGDDIGEIKVESDWALPSESTLIEHTFSSGTGGIENVTPDTDLVNYNPQPWFIPSDQTTYGAFDLSASGLVPDSGTKQCLAMVRCGPEGTFTCRWTASSTGRIYFGLMFRVWAGLGSDSYLLYRYDSTATAGQELRLVQGSTPSAVIGSSAPTGVTVSAGKSYEMKVIARGRFFWCYLKNITDGGSEQLQFSGPNASSNRGQLSEDHAGPFTISTVADNLCTYFAYSGRKRSETYDYSIGSNRFAWDPMAVCELYNTGFDTPTRNLFWSKGIQGVHVSEADGGNYIVANSNPIAGTHVKVIRQRGRCLRENAILADGECYVTFLRRGIWMDDGLFYRGGGGSINFTPDNDWRPDLLSTTYRWIDSTGSSSSRTKSFATWAGVVSTTGLPKAYQVITNGTNKVRVHAGMRNILNCSSLTTEISDKLEGNGDPFSIAFNVPGTAMTADTEYRVGRSYFVESGALSLDATWLTDFRDDLKTVKTCTVSTGTLKTDASGDRDTDGFNERYGWYEVNCSGGVASLEFTVSSGRLIWPVIRFNSHTVGASPTVTIAGSAGVSGTDYVWDDLGDGTGILQILSSRTANTTVSISGTSSSSSRKPRYFFYYNKDEQRRR